MHIWQLEEGVYSHTLCGTSVASPHRGLRFSWRRNWKWTWTSWHMHKRRRLGLDLKHVPHAASHLIYPYNMSMRSRTNVQLDVLYDCIQHNIISTPMQLAYGAAALRSISPLFI